MSKPLGITSNPSDYNDGAATRRSDEENYALMTISTGQTVETEVTPGILGAVAAYQAVFQDNVGAQFVVVYPWKLRSGISH